MAGTQANSSTNGASGDRLTELASKAKVPLVIGGAAVAGAVGGAVRHRTRNRPSGAAATLRKVSSSVSPGKLDPRRLDVDRVKSAGERLSALGQQTVDIANAVEKTRKKHK